MNLPHVVHPIRSISSRALGGFALLLPLLLASTPCAAVTLSDGTFNPADWTMTVLVGTGTPVTSQVLTGGNPDAYRRTQLTWDTGLVRVAHIRAGVSVNPAACGGIATIGWSYDLTSFTSNQTNYGIVLHQGDNWFIRTGETISQMVPWTHFDHAGSASSTYIWVLGPAGSGSHPDFSAAGAPIEVGYLTSGFTGNPNTTTETGIDNWSVTATDVGVPLNVTTVGTGTVTRTPDLANYPCGTKVTLSASAGPCYRFTGWSGDVTSDASSVSIVVDAPKNVTATFTLGTAIATFTDGTFNDGDWTATTIVGTGTVTANQVATGGNPNEYRRTVLNWSSGLIRVAHMRSGAVVDPSVYGGISQIDFAYDLTSFTSNQTNYGVVIHQGPDWYVNNPETVSLMQPWTRYRHASLGSGNFAWVAGTAGAGTHPDFSASGGPIELGYVTSGFTGNPNTTTDTGIDNWKVVVASNTFKLNVSVVGSGSVTPAQRIFACGDPVTLTAVPDDCNMFTGWSGDVSGSTNPLSLVVGSNLNIVANFAISSTAVPDGVFNPSDWTTTVIVDPGPHTVDANQVASGGNPDEYRRVKLTWGPGTIRVAHMRNGAVMNAAPVGGVASIDYSYDLTSFTSNQTRYALLLHQVDDWYLDAGDLASLTMPWTHFDHTGLVAASFTWVAGPNPGSQPDFSAAGAPIALGYATWSSTGSAGAITETGLDNWRVRMVGVCGAPAGVELPVPVVSEALRAAPNPFHSTLRIELALPRAEKVEARVLDVAGRVIRRLSSGVLGAGRQSLVWDGRDAAGNRAASGVYLIQVLAGERSLTTRVVRIR